ncbi:MAG: ABC transporter permease subunit [Polyangiaceae bacterium]
MDMIRGLLPNQVVSKGTLRLYALGWAFALAAAWSLSGFEVLPTPWEVLRELNRLRSSGLAFHLASSSYSSAVALLWTALIGLPLAYLSVIPALRPLTGLVEKLRFWGFAGVAVVFTLWFGGGHNLKIALLVFGMTGFFVASMHDEVRSIPKERFDYARALGMGEWRVLWEVVVRGTLDRAFDVLRQNAAMGWMLLTLVETLVRSEGGIGVLLANQSKHMQLAALGAVQLVVFGVGIVQDALLVALKRVACPHAALELERS